jgi:hypothetical protein
VSTITLTPASDEFLGTGWSKNGFSGSYSAALSDGSDSTFGAANSDDAGTTGTLGLTLSAIPSNVTAITGATASIRGKQNATKTSSNVAVSVGIPGNTTKLCARTSVTPTSSFSTLTSSMTVSDATIADWGSAVLVIAMPDDGNNNTVDVSEASVILTVVQSNDDGTAHGACGEDSSWMFGTSLHRGRNVFHRILHNPLWSNLRHLIPPRRRSLKPSPALSF